MSKTDVCVICQSQAVGGLLMGPRGGMCDWCAQELDADAAAGAGQPDLMLPVKLGGVACLAGLVGLFPWSWGLFAPACSALVLATVLLASRLMWSGWREGTDGALTWGAVALGVGMTGGALCALDWFFVYFRTLPFNLH